ncbi:MAG: DUF4079 domain-containing protein, partial [Thermodesulfobacteriota bacterium]
MLLFIHPLIQATAILLAAYAFLTGLQRFRALHLHQQTTFPWKRHVLIGRITLAMILAGMILGLAMVRFHWQKNLMTMGHGEMGLVLIPFLLFGIVSGLILDSKGKGRKTLRLLHGINNTLVLLL